MVATVTIKSGFTVLGNQWLQDDVELQFPSKEWAGKSNLIMDASGSNELVLVPHGASAKNTPYKYFMTYV